MSKSTMNNKNLGKYLLWGVGLTAVAIFLTFVLVIIMTAFASSTNVPVLAMLSFIVVALGAVLYAWYQNTKN